MSQDFTEKTLSSTVVYSGEFLEVRRDQSMLIDGAGASREVVIHPGASMIIPIFNDHTILLENQYRYAVGSHCLEFPAGKRDNGETTLETARRELLEETGYVAEFWKEVMMVHPGVGYTNERITIFIAQQLEMRTPSRDDGELLETIRMSIDEAFLRLKSGSITDAKTIIGLFMVRDYCKKK